MKIQTLNKPKDLLYIVRQGDDNEELRYSLRSVAKNLPHSKIVIAGYCPEWVINVDVVARYQTIGTKYENSTRNLRIACNNSKLSDDFVLMNDDFFIMAPIKEVPVLHRGPVEYIIQDYIKRHTKSLYLTGMIETTDLMAELGITYPKSYELHVPMNLNREKVLEMLSLYRTANRKPRVLHKRTLYGNYFQEGGREIKDVKIYKAKPDFDITTSTFLSTDDDSFRFKKIGQYIRDQFPDKSPYEI